MSDPLDSFREFVERIRPGELPSKYRRWTGNDESARNHNCKVGRNENPLVMHLSWRANGETPAKFVGCYRINMPRLVREGYALPEGTNEARLRFYHDSDGVVYIGRGQKFPRIPVGKA